MRSYRYLLLGLALICYVHSAAAAAARYPLVVRQDESASEGSQVPTATNDGSSRPSSTSAPQESSIVRTASDRPSTTKEVETSSSFSVTASTPATTISNAPSTSTSAVAHAKDQLPIHPKITPALGLAGTLMLISGAVYAVIGIKNKWLYVFASAAYLTSLAVTVLIVYLMNPPVSNAIQGAFFVAVCLTGLIFGALSLVFSDITDGLGCLLGGFCLSMWFLTTKEGGLIASSTGRAIFIGCMSAAGFTLSFSHYTRTYGLMASISFAGATITVLGIDCFSRAGWKEFWLYLWALNADTFPLFTDTYPITRGIKVELAGVVLLSLFGVVSQLRLWRLVKDRREKAAAQRLERERNQELVEEELGRKIEDNFQRERAQWEAAYGDKNAQESSVDSCVTTPKTSMSVREKSHARSNSIEMTTLPRDGLARSASKQATVTISVLPEDEIQQIDGQGHPISQSKDSFVQPSIPDGTNGSTCFSSEIGSLTGLPRSVSARSSLGASVPPPPTVVPLPFQVPMEEDAETRVTDNSSVSAVLDTVEEHLSNRRSLSKRVSAMSGMNRLSTIGVSPDESESEEALMIPHVEDDRASSVAATLDEADNVSLPELSPPHSPLVLKFDTHLGSSTGTNNNVSMSSQYRTSSSEYAGVDVTEDSSPLEAGIRPSLTISTDPPADAQLKRNSSQSPRIRCDTVVSVVKDESIAPSRSSQNEHSDSAVGSFTGALPAKLSKVALSYRTNEWAKHLEVAEKPDLDEIPVPGSPGVQLKHESEEPPFPVSEELVQPLIVAKRNSNRVSTGNNPYRSSGLIRSNSNTPRNSQSQLQMNKSFVPAAGDMSRSNSQLQDRTARNSSTPLPPVAEAAGRRLSSAPTPTPSNTLLAQRETRVQNRTSSQSLNPGSASPTAVAAGAGGDQDSMTLAQRKRLLQHQKPPSASQKWRQSNMAPVGSQIQEFDSHQPKRSPSGSDQKREVLLAGWRESIRQEAAPGQAPAPGNAMMSAKRQKEAERQQQAMAAQHRESMINSMMRSNEMQDAHREALRRMQARANKHA